jgi:hypothetical protein
MKKLLFILLIFSTNVWSQRKLLIIKATSKTASVNDGGVLNKNFWRLVPEAKPDIYTADRTRKTKWVTFYTDIDSIKVKVKPGTVFDFIVLLNGKDSCYTQIASVISLEKNAKNIKITHDTIPFRLHRNTIFVQSIMNDKDSLTLHLDLGSFDLRITRDAILKKTHLLPNREEVLAGKVKPNYSKLAKVSKLQMGNLILENPTVVPTLLTSHDADGRFAGNLFEGKVIEIDYDKNLIIIHSKLPKKLDGFSKSKLEFISSYPCIKGVINAQDKNYETSFILDTGSEMAMLLDSTWRIRNKFPTDLKLIKLTSFKDPRNVKYESRVVNLPKATFQNIPLINVPTTLMGSRNPTGFEINLLGNDVLKRFNTIIDFRNDYIYLKPNSLFNMPFKEAS